MANRFEIAKYDGNNPMWVVVGGRPCPEKIYGCSQNVYQDAVSGQFDYGYPGGPSFNECEDCKQKRT